MAIGRKQSVRSSECVCKMIRNESNLRLPSGSERSSPPGSWEPLKGTRAEADLYKFAVIDSINRSSSSLECGGGLQQTQEQHSVRSIGLGVARRAAFFYVLRIVRSFIHSSLFRRLVLLFCRIQF